jgi:WD repeat-containing protein 35
MLLGLEKEAMLHSQKKSIQNAIDVSIKHNRWKDAMMLDNQDDSIINTKVKDLAVHKARDFLSEGNIALAIQTYRIVEDYDKAASLLRQLAEKICKGSKQMLLAKKLFILAAYDIDSSQRQNREKWSGRQASVEVATLNSLVTSTSVHDTWRAAAACHYYLLSHRQFHKSKFTRSMLTALRCSEYIDILPACDVYALIALTAYRSKYFKVCSKAITKLGSLKILDEHMKRTIEYVVRKFFQGFLIIIDSSFIIRSKQVL